MLQKDSVEILFFGDIVGKPGRVAVRAYLNDLPRDQWPDVVIANAENVTHGFGLSEKHYQELRNIGIDVLTGGNHIWDRKEIVDYLPQVDRLLRPLNMPAPMPGSGYGLFELAGGVRIGVINLIGQVYMGNYNSPWERLAEVVADLQAATPLTFVDFHAEATAEKMAMGLYCSELGVSAMVGTHTHVQTADERILNGQTGYLTDAGFNGAFDSVIGMDPESSLMRLKSMVPVRMEVALSQRLQVNAVRFRVHPQTGLCESVERVNTVLVPCAEMFNESALP